jgi:hypothetical protein
MDGSPGLAFAGPSPVFLRATGGIMVGTGKIGHSGDGECGGRRFGEWELLVLS